MIRINHISKLFKLKMSFETINYEISLWKGSSLVVDSVSMVQAIRNWWGGNLSWSDLLIKALDLSLTLLDRYFNTDKTEAIDRAYKTLGFSRPFTHNKAIIMKRYKKLTTLYHPDKGGSLEKMRDINVARDLILESL